MGRRDKGSKEDQEKAYKEYQQAQEERKANFPCPTCGRHYTTSGGAQHCYSNHERDEK